MPLPQQSNSRSNPSQTSIHLVRFLDASSHLYKRPCPSVGPLVGRSVTLSSKSMKNGHFRILNDLNNAGRGRKREEEGGTRRKEGRGGRRDKEEGGTRSKEGGGERSDVEEGAMRRVKK